MKKTCLFGGALVAAGLTAGANAQVIMDFQSLEMAGGGFSYWGSSYSANGFTITQGVGEPFSFATAQTGNAGFYQGSTMMFNNTVLGVTTLTKDDGGTFDLASIDLAGLFVGGGDTTVTFTANNGSVASFTTSNGGSGIQTFSFAGLGFDGILSVSWLQDFAGAGAFHQFDNIAIVPAPAGVALLGLGGLVATRRRR